MKFIKKVVVAVSLDDNTHEQLSPLRDMEFLTHCEVHFVHVFNIIRYTGVIFEFPIAYPYQADNKPIEESVLAILTKIAKEALPKNFDGKVVHRCLFYENPRHGFSEYVNETKADLVIIPTRKKHGFFESSFAQYINRHTEANMFFLKNH